ncbi:MAG: glycosyltransferase family 39 protein, partial [Anaerolineae bacterium]|nr:glycosyltransferase family 39 protein [Anaerolineae bacterium]
MTNGERCSAFVICSFFICSFVLRLAPLGRYVTPDEPAWVYRSICFADALTARDWSAVPSTGHPGVTTMWLGALGVAARRLLNPAESLAHLDWIRRLAWLAPENGEAFRHLVFFLPWGRVAVALVTTLGLVALYPLLTRLFDRRVALLAVGLLAFDPFLIGHSGLLHTDALLATFSLLALVAALNGLREPHRAVWWAISGLFTGLALLTKTPALILPPFIILLLAIRHLQSAIRHSPFAIRHSLFAIRHYSLLILLTIITCLALYPAL